MNALLQRSPLSPWLLAVVAATFLVLGACGDDDIVTGDEADLLVQPSSVDFGNVVIGETTTRTVELINNEEPTIRLTNLALDEAPDSDANHEVFEIVNPWDGALELEEDESYTLEIEYTPEAPEPYGAEISFNTSISDLPTETIEVRATTPAPELLADDTVVFDRTPAGSSEWRLTELENIGTADLEIEDIVLGGHDENDFDLAFPVEDDEDPSQPAGTESDMDSPPSVLAPGESAWIRVHFTAPNDDFRRTEIIVRSNVPTRRIAVAANSDAACLELVGGSVEFGLAAIDNTTQQTVTLRNCSALSETVITNLTLGHLDDDENFEEGGDIRFGIDEDSLPGDLAEGGSMILDPGETTSFLMTYSPLAEQQDEAVLSASSTDEASPLLADITGEGADLECPIAEAEAQIAGTNVWGTDVFGVPLDDIEFDGSGSYDPDGTDVTYEWTLIDHPQNSTASLDNPESVNPELRVDIAGPFTVELTVYDAAGIASCDPSIINIWIEPESSIHVELTWDVPAAPDGTGTDLDLHYLHPLGTWSEAPYGVYWANSDPDWDDGSDVSLDIDDLYGEEPENINHDNPDPNYDYSVGVYYFGDAGWPATDARVRIFFHDQVVLDLEERLHNGGASNGDFWRIADIGVIPPNTPAVDQLQVYDELTESSGFPAN